MKFTGERYLPQLEDPQISLEHWHRYLYALRFATGKVVLDIACGEGYGAHLLSETARRVIGVDIDAESVNYASSRYISDNLKFKLGSATQIPIKGRGVVDLVVSFETIEHLCGTDQQLFLREVKRLLKPEGVFIMSTPNRLNYSDVPGFRNEFHIGELYVDELVGLLRSEFTKVRLLGQRIYPMGYIWPIGVDRPFLAEYRLDWTEAGYRPTAVPKQMLYLLAIAGNAPIPKLDASVLVDIPESMARRHPRVLAREERIRALEAEAQATQQSIEALRGKLRGAQETKEVLEGQVGALTGQIEAVQAGRSQLMEEAASREERIRALEAEAQATQQSIEALRGELRGAQETKEMLEGQVGALTRRVEAVQAGRSQFMGRMAEREERIRVLEAEVHTTQQSVEELREELRGTEEAKGELAGQVGALTRQIEAAEAERSQLLGGGAEREERIHALEAEVHTTQQSVEALQGELRGTQEAKGALEGERSNLTQLLAEQESQAENSQRLLNTLTQSKSWRLTAPLRWIYFRLLHHGALHGRWEPAPEALKALWRRLGFGISSSTLVLVRNNASRLQDPGIRDTILPYHRNTESIEHAWRSELKLFLSNESAEFTFPSVAEPLVSIVIPTFNRSEYLYQSLKNLLAYTDVPFEVILVDDCSCDETSQLLERLANVRIARNERREEFIRSCNRGASLARGRYLLFLNNDVLVTPRWLSHLVATMEAYPKSGVVGAKLVRLDGSLQEAGSIVWNDGSTLGYGRDDDPLKAEYSYLREVDFCSAACLLVRTELFAELGGFDELYLPAYYEDVDLCFSVRRLGYKVVVDPRVAIFHYEFGSGSFERAKLLCEENRPKFVEKWGGDCAHQHPWDNILRARDRRSGMRVLVMDDAIPAPHLGSGFPRTHTMLTMLVELGYVVTFAPLSDKAPQKPTTEQLQQLGIEVFYGDRFDPDELVRKRAGLYDIVIISRPHNGAAFLRLARQHFPEALIVYDAEAIFCMREFLRARVEGRTLDEAERRKMLAEELQVMREADVIVTVSEAERRIVADQDGSHDVVVWGFAHDVNAPVTSFAERKDVLFVGGFTAGNPPNADSVIHFATKLFPRIRERLPGCRFFIIGSQPPEHVRELASDDVIVTGFVDDLRRYYERCRVFVVPLRFGAGIPYKLTEAMSYGIPSVASTLAASGLNLRDGREALIANTDQEFVDKVIHLYEDEVLWTTVQRGSLDYIQCYCSIEAMKRRLGEILRTPPRAKVFSG